MARILSQIGTFKLPALSARLADSRPARAWRSTLEGIDRRFPELSRRLGGKLGVQLPAIGVSVVVHAALLATCAMIGLAVTAPTESRIFNSAITAGEDVDVTRIENIDLTTPDTPMTPKAGSFGPDIAATPTKDLPQNYAPVTASKSGSSASLFTLSRPDLAKAADIMLPKSANLLDQTVSIKGAGAEHVGGVEGAVDRVAQEILQKLEKGRTLVVWAFDASGSLQAERERLATHIEAVYSHIDALDDKQLSKSGGLLSMVYSFGKDRRALTPKPTADLAAIKSAIHQVDLDASGIESTFQTVIDIVRKWGKYRPAGEKYQTMIIIVTDEVGDDEPKLEESVAAAAKAKVPVFVLGSSALFGETIGYMAYTDPRTKKTYPRLPVRQGPESVAIERIRLPYWYDGPQFETFDAGFGPYALSRLCGATQGIYFVTRLGPERIMFDPQRMREYRPDWVSRQKYEQMIAKDPVRMAVVKAGMIAQQNLPGQPSLTFPAAGTPEFKDAMRDNQVIAARILDTVNAALEPINAAAKFRDRETSRRWQAHYDLIRGRLMAMKVRCDEYNYICARMKRDAPKFQDAKSNAWRLKPDEYIHDDAKARGNAKIAKEALERVIKEHPGTPWALLAQRDFKDPLGFKWMEVSVPPPPKRMDAPAAAKKKAEPKPAPPPKPEELPKL